MSKKQTRISTQMLATLGALLAIEIILSRFLSVNAWNIKIGFNFVPIAIAALLFGALPAGIVAALGDFLGAMLFPIGPYFPGFTLTAFLTGCVLGIFLHQKRTVARTVTAVLINQMILGLFLNTLWISILYGASYQALLLTRLVQALILSAVQIAGILILSQLFKRLAPRRSGSNQ